MVMIVENISYSSVINRKEPILLFSYDLITL